MAAPNIETSSNPTQTGGNASGVKVGNDTEQTLGFYGETGVAQQVCTASVATIHASLVALGLIRAS
jgi:hypothetical protein